MTQPHPLPEDLWILHKEQPDHPHALRVAHHAAQAAPRLAVPPQDAYTAGLLHDLGKLAIPQHLLHAPRPLTPAERTQIRTHPTLSAQIVHRLWPHCPTAILHAVMHHHERQHGLGYPHGLKQLPTLTALIAACDVWDALTHPRPYRPALHPAVAADLLHQEHLPRHVIQAVLHTATPNLNLKEVPTSDPPTGDAPRPAPQPEPALSV